MKGSRVILVVAALLLIFCASTLRAQEEYSMPLTKSINPGITVVKYSTITYHFVSEDYFSVKFERLDAKHVELSIKPVKQGAKPYYEITVELGDFPGTELQVNWPDGNSFIFDTETGYAEK